MSVDPASAATSWLLGRTEPEDAQAHGPDVSPLSRDLGELADALTRARTGVAAIEPPVTAAGGPSLLAATQELETLVWFMREQGIEPQLCDRIDACVGNIRAACAVPGLTTDPTRAIAEVLGDLESRLHRIRTALDGGAYAPEPFDDLSALPAANANSPTSARPVVIEEQFHDHVTASAADAVPEAEKLADAFGDSGAVPTLEGAVAFVEPGAAEAADAIAEPAPIQEAGSAEAAVIAEPGATVEPGAAIVEAGATAGGGTIAEDAAFVSVETVLVVTPEPPAEISPAEVTSSEVWPDASPAENLERYFDDAPATPMGTRASPRLTPRLMEAELDRLLDAQASAAFTPSPWREPEPAAGAAPRDETHLVQAMTVVEAAPAVEAPAPVDVIAPVEPTLPAEEIAPGEPATLIEPTPEAEPIALSEPIPSALPTAPSEPTSPVEPIALTEPAPSAEPTAPSEPSPPPEPIALSEPAPSAEPTAPSEPTSPAEPTALTEPTPPAEPTAPVEPTPPAEPIALSEPAPPTEPTAPSEHTPPAAATAPEQAVAPAETAPLQPEPPKAVKRVAPKPPRRVTEIARDKFTDVMALTEAERTALFS
jgi:hypothetical protein